MSAPLRRPAALVAALATAVTLVVPPAVAAAAPAARDVASACPALDLTRSRFSDVAGTHLPGVACVARWGITEGVTRGRFEPHRAVTRGQVGSFLARALDSTGGDLPPTAPRAFADTRGSVHRDPVDRLAARGIMNGVGGRYFAPQAPVRRDQMASMLVRAYEHLAGRALPVGGRPFSDVRGNTHETNIRKAAEAGITGGVGGGAYDPSGTVSRQQMATFVSRFLATAVDELGVRAPDDGRSGPYLTDTFSRDGAFLVTNGSIAYGPDGGATSSPILRATTRRRDFQDVRVTLEFQHRGFVTGPRTPARDFDGINVWIRHRSQYELYYATFNRRDGKIVIKKKDPRPDDPANNHGEYFTLAQADRPFPAGQTQRMSVEAEDVGRGRVRLAIRDEAGRVVLETVDDGSIGGPALTGPGATGIRGDNSSLRLRRLEVAPL